MSNTIKVTKCDNQLILTAFQWSKSYEICNLKAASNLDYNITIKEGPYTGPATQDSPTVYLPKGDYNLVYAGINWGGPYNFEFEFQEKKYQLLNNASKPLVGVIWSLGNNSISFNVVKETATVI